MLLLDQLSSFGRRYTIGRCTVLEVQVELPPQFVIPGGTPLSAQLDLARAVIRRAERAVAALDESAELASEAVLRFVNRASDLAYAMARATDVDEPELFSGRHGQE